MILEVKCLIGHTVTEDGFQYLLLPFQVFDYTHSCSIPSNGMNLIIFDLCNVVLLLIIVDASFNLFWHYRFYGKRSSCIQTKLGRLIHRYEVMGVKKNIML